jgi:hypothetical protein
VLHIVNGDTVADKLNKGVVQGEVIVWREIFTEGALSENIIDPSDLEKRAVSLEKMMGIPSKEYLHNILLQEKQLTQAVREKEIVLWFEHDLFDQTILWYLLYRLDQLQCNPEHIYLISIDEYPGVEPFFGIGQLSVEQLNKLSGTRQRIGREQLALGCLAWQAYTSDTPWALQQLLNTDTAALPFLKDAVQFHLSRFPSVRNGLSVVEQFTLEILDKHDANPYELFRLVSNQVPLYGVGDLQFWSMLQDMYNCTTPLIDIVSDKHSDNDGLGETKGKLFPGYAHSIPVRNR